MNQGNDILIAFDLCRALRVAGGVRDLDEAIEFRSLADLQFSLPKMNNLIVGTVDILNLDFYMKRMIILIHLS